MTHRETERRAVSFFLFRYLVGEVPHLGGGQITVIPAVRNGKDGRGNGDGFFFFSSLFLWGERMWRCGAPPPRSLSPRFLTPPWFLLQSTPPLSSHTERGGDKTPSPPSGTPCAERGGDDMAFAEGRGAYKSGRRRGWILEPRATVSPPPLHSYV